MRIDLAGIFMYVLGHEHAYIEGSSNRMTLRTSDLCQTCGRSPLMDMGDANTINSVYVCTYLILSQVEPNKDQRVSLTSKPDCCAIILIMAPKPKASTESLKQKSLTSFFGKGSGVTPSKPIARVTPRAALKPSDASEVQSSPSKSHKEPQTPASKVPNSRTLSSAVSNSPISSNGGSFPPTSDPADVDMLSDQEDEEPRVQVKPVSSRATGTLRILTCLLVRPVENARSFLMTLMRMSLI